MAQESDLLTFLRQESENASVEINSRCMAEIEDYRKNPCPSCSRNEAVKLLKRFAGKSFPDFWNEPVKVYLPAVSQGIMKLSDMAYSHDEAVAYAKKLAEDLSEKALARAFLYGAVHGAPEYMTALACYHYVKNLPEHTFEKRYIGASVHGEVYSEDVCEVCGYNSKRSEEPKMRFWHINTDMHFFYQKARIFYCLNLNTAIVYLREFATLPCPRTSAEDYARFMEVIALIEALPEDATPGKAQKALKQSGLLKLTNEQTAAFVDQLGYLNILHSQDSYGVTVGHTKETDMLPPHNDRTFFAYPVNRWSRKCGIDYGSIDRLFEGIYQ